jgi:hypothetical protein
MEPKIIMPLRTAREVKDRAKLFSKFNDRDYDELDAIIDRKKRESIFEGGTITTIPNMGDDGWFPTEEEIVDFLDKHKPLTKIDVVFLRHLLTVKNSKLYTENMMSDSQLKAYAIVSKLNLGQNRKK